MAVDPLIDFDADTFTRHKIERSVPVEALIKCKMQDNLEFLQWTKRFWDQYFPGGEYDAISRRKASGSTSNVTPAASSRTSGAGAARRGVTPTGGVAKSSRAMGGGPGSAALANENAQLKETVTGLERERDFYFSKLRDIELLLQQAVELDPKLESDDEGLVKQVQAILYSTEVIHSSTILKLVRFTDQCWQDGFEIPADAEGAADDLETF